MTRARIATDRVARLQKPEILEALIASSAAESDRAFYEAVGMRNPSRSYYVHHGRQPHSLKAVVAYALQQEQPETLARDFHAQDAASRLRELGFNVVHLNAKRELAREHVWLKRLARTGQSSFRQMLIGLRPACAISGCTTLSALEAAHVDPVSKQGSDKSKNGLLLRADLHRLFDLNLIAINPTNGKISIAPECYIDYCDLLSGSVYKPLAEGPPLAAFGERWKEHQELLTGS